MRVKEMRILGIETSCDETSVALLQAGEDRVRVLKEMTASQVTTHADYGGVVPEVAARMHVETLPLIVAEMGLGKDDVDAVAVTRGPGLVTSLRVGTDFARGLAYGWKKPIVGVNHMEGHVAANFIVQASSPKPQAPSLFPAVVLIVSGGHTDLVLMRGIGKYRRLGGTLDDAAGEAFDKVAKMLGLGYPGGPAVSKRAEKGDSTRYALPRPMLAEPGSDFSFSGLKTAVLYTLQRKPDWSAREVDDLCASFQAAVVEVLVAKTIRAAKATKAKTVFLAGGVAANKLLRETLAAEVKRQTSNVKCTLPDLAYCTDNAAMIAMAAWFRLSKDARGDDWRKLMPDPNWELGV